MSKVAAIDCGTNSIRLLISSVEPGQINEVLRDTQLVRLGQGVDQSHRFAPEALERTFAACDQFKVELDRHLVSADLTRFVATSAARDVANRDEFFAGVYDRLGVRPEVISGHEEANLSYRGAVTGLAAIANPIVVSDIGGGSTELAVGVQDQLQNSVSLDIGSVRLRERFLTSDPATEEELARASNFVDQQLDTAKIDFSGLKSWIGVAGSVTSLGAMYLGLTSYDREKVNGTTIAISDVRDIAHKIMRMSVAELVDLGFIKPMRAQVLAAGAVIIDRIAARIGASNLRVSEHDILDGIVLGLADKLH